MKTSHLFLIIVLLFFAANASALVTKHFIDGQEVHQNQQVETKNPFEYKIMMTNDSNQHKVYTVKEIISRELTLVTANYKFDKIETGHFSMYTFHIPMDGGSTTNLIMDFRNDTNEALETASINVSFYHGPSLVSEFKVFLLWLKVPAIPEFEFLAIPIGAVIGSYFLVRRSQRKEPK